MFLHLRAFAIFLRVGLTRIAISFRAVLWTTKKYWLSAMKAKEHGRNKLWSSAVPMKTIRLPRWLGKNTRCERIIGFSQIRSQATQCCSQWCVTCQASFAENATARLFAGGRRKEKREGGPQQQQLTSCRSNCGSVEETPATGPRKARACWTRADSRDSARGCAGAPRTPRARPADRKVTSCRA